MIIGEQFNQAHLYAHSDDNYDYLFRLRSKEERKERKEERHQRQEIKKQEKQARRDERNAENQAEKQGVAYGREPKRGILGNFGLFGRKKDKEKTATKPGTIPSSAHIKTAPDSSNSGTSSEGEQNLFSNSGTSAQDGGRSASSARESREGTDPNINTSGTNDSGSGTESDAGAGSAAKEKSTAPDKKEQDKPGGGGAVWLGFALMGTFIIVAGIIMYKVDKKSQEKFIPIANRT